MRSILYIKGSSLEDVRVKKFLSFFVSKKYNVTYWGWNRNKSNVSIPGIKNHDILSGGGLNNKKLLFYYPFWMCVLFFKTLFSGIGKKEHIVVINFDSALPVYLASRIRRFKYIYEIYDEFAISYKFPSWLKKVIQKIDNQIMKKARAVIHVDKNRIRYTNCKIIVIENTPYDYFKGKNRAYNNITHTFAVTGLLNNSRGISQIIRFARTYKQIEFLAIGEVCDKELLNDMKKTPNIKIYDFMPQEKVFDLLQNCCGIFSLYDPDIEIYRLAASNKVYDAMMLGIPIITNKEVLSSAFIKKENIGYVINYKYDSSWHFLASQDYLKTVRVIGENSRNLYLEKFIFPKLVEKRLLPILSNNINN
jgi:glycosyltransferase involved in cell wall biosynthesis